MTFKPVEQEKGNREKEKGNNHKEDNRMEGRSFSEEKAVAASQFTRERDYWLKQLSGEIVKTCFPYSFPGASPGPGKMEIHEFTIQGAPVQQVMKLSKGSSARVHMILMAGVMALLAKYTDFNQITAGVPIYKQENQGDFINTVLTLRNRLEPDMTFKELLLEVRQGLIEANEHANYPIEQLLYHLELPVSQHEFPLFDLAVLLEDIHDKEYLGGIPLNMIFLFRANGTVISGRLEYNALLYDKPIISRLVDHYVHLMQGALFDLNFRISELEILGESEKQQLLYDFNDTAADYLLEETLHELFEKQALNTPDFTALVYEHRRLTYAGLNKRADSLACQLRRCGVKRDQVVGIMVEDPFCMVIGLLAILKAGSGYLPLDIDYPPRRKKHILDDSGISVLVTESRLKESIDTVTTTIKASPELVFADDNTLYGGEKTNPGSVNTSNELAYVIYTSGTTGRPKGVMISHSNAINTLTWFAREFEIKAGINLLQLTDYTFDPSVEDIFGTLLHGATLHVGCGEIAVNPGLFGGYVRANQVHIIDFIPTMLEELLCRQDRLESLKIVISGGEKLEESLKEQIRARGYSLYNNYGPTEVAIDALSGKCSPARVTLGHPITNTCCCVFTNRHTLAPVGIPGELCISGQGLARGYMNNPELTAASFLENPFFPGQRMYCTGDWVKWLSDGTIEFIGRTDRQVKIRGYRIEPGEIEVQIKSFPDVREGVVTDRKRPEGETYLCAYVVGHKDRAGQGQGSVDELDTRELRRYLIDSLPDYLVPAYIVALAELPLTSTGKIDRKALPEPEITDMNQALMPPRDRLEQELVRVWAGVLGVDENRLGIDSNFFESGGHSLKATILVSRLHKAIQVKLPLSVLFRYPTIREMAAHIKSLNKDKFQVIGAVEAREYYALSSAQQRLYVLQQMKKDSIAYNMPLWVVLEGEVDKEKLQDIFRELIRRHESFRTSFEMIDKQPVQRIHQEMPFDLELYDFDPEGHDDFEMLKGFIRPFDLSQPPLVRGRLAVPGQDRSLLIVDMHHIISDGVSQDIATGEFMWLLGGQELPLLRLQYRDYAQWQNMSEIKESLRQQGDYWLKEFQGKVPLLNLPTDYERTQIIHFEGSSVSFTIVKQLTSKLKACALQLDVTLMMLLYSVYQVLLSRYANQEEIVTGTVAAGRQHTDLENIIGFFVNMLPIKTSPQLHKTFSHYLAEVKEKTVKAFENQGYPFEELVNNLDIPREPGRHPLVDAVFSYLEGNRTSMNNGVNNRDKEDQDSYPGLNISHFDLLLLVQNHRDSISMLLEYSTDLFKRSTMEEFSHFYMDILNQVIDNPKILLKEIEFDLHLQPARALMEEDSDDWGL